MTEPPRESSVHPRHYRRSIVAVAMLAMATWWGIGLPYSLFAWLLDGKQRAWTLFCYLWEVPVFGLVGLVLIPQLLWRDIERRWTAMETAGANATEATVLERKILDYPLVVAVVLLIASLIGYLVGALQIRWYAELPFAEAVKVCLLGLVTGLVGALFAYLYLEWRLAPLLRYLPIDDASAPSTGRRIPLSAKVFGCSLVLTITVLLLLGTIFYSRGERILEEEVGRRVQAAARHLADELAAPDGGAHLRDADWWRARETRMELGPSGHALVVAPDGTIVGGSTNDTRLADEGFRPAVVAHVLRGDGGHLVDRVYQPRIVAFASYGTPTRHVVAIVQRAEFAGELEAMLRRGSIVFVMALLLTLLQGYLFSHRITRPIEILTRMASDIARAPGGGAWPIVPVRTNDEVGELANAFNRMTGRLEEARSEVERYSAELERRIAEATRNIATLYDVTRTTTSTIELDVVLKLVVDKIMTALDLPRLVLLWHPPDLERAVDAYTTASDADGGRLELGETIDLTTLCPAPHLATVTTRATLGPRLPESIARVLTDPDVLCLPLVFKDQFLGLVLASIDSRAGTPNLALAGALASQAAAALANAGLFETARRHEAELRKLSQVRVQLQEESLRSLSRELHDGVGQVLTAIKMDLGMIERASGGDGHDLKGRVREVREQVTELLQEVRTMSQLLRPSMLDDFGLVPTLQWLVEKFTVRTRIEVDLRTPASDTRLPPAIEVLLYRVTQEALTNVVKHARAKHVDVEFAVRAGEASLTIADDGVGFDVERFRRTPAAGGVGLLGMRERVAYYRGRIEFRSRPDDGMRISLTIPIDDPTDTERGDGGRMTSVG
jgi:signal transduction histidine kinase